MRKTAPYIIITLIAIAVVGLIFTGNNEREKEFDDRITLQKEDNIPYGARVAFETLPHIFPHAKVSVNTHGPGYWDSLSMYDDDQALIIISPQLYADEFELKKMIRFMEYGNDVFISTRAISNAVEKIIPINISRIYDDIVPDSLLLQLTNPPFTEKDQFTYDASGFYSWIPSYDTSLADILGGDDRQNVNFIHFKVGKGNLYLHLAPLTFSNYFLLQKDNIRYYENALSVISPSVNKVVWDEYFLNRQYLYEQYPESQGKSGHPGWWSVLFRFNSLKWALLVSMLTLLLYVVMEMRRRQRFIPIITRPKNETLDFVKTIGRLYFDRGDHLNLCRKMATYFLEHVRNTYKLSTVILDDNFTRNLQFKSGYSEKELKDIVSFIWHLKSLGSVSEKQVATFHSKLEKFYQHT